MIFRLGSRSGIRSTHFALAKSSDGWSDYFFVDQDVFGGTEIEVFLPDASIRSLFAYQLLPALTETSLVNLALASGSLPQALGITSGLQQAIPATGQSIFTFDFQPISASEMRLQHERGQVEIDALFVERREGRECLFVIEAKVGKGFDSLAKHKLLYPILALQHNIPSDIDIVPVYLRAVRREGHIEFNIAECSLPRRDGRFGALDEVRADKITRYSLHAF